MDKHVSVRSSAHVYFHALLKDAMREARTKMEWTTELYLVFLLAGLRPDHLSFEETFAELALKAKKADGFEQNLRWTRLGDKALLTAGVFWPNVFARCGLDLDYVSNFGERAYRQIEGPPFEELGERFREMVHVLQVLSLSCSLAGKGMDLLRLYSAWTDSGNELFRKMLVERGIDPGVFPQRMRVQ